MARTDGTGVPHTCPLLDKILHEVSWLKDKVGDVMDVEETLETIESLVEEIRGHNDTLRGQALEHIERVGVLESDLEEVRWRLGDRIQELTDERDNALEELEKVTAKLEELELLSL